MNFYQILLSVTTVGEKDLPINVFKVPVSGNRLSNFIKYFVITKTIFLLYIEDDININCTHRNTVINGTCHSFNGNPIPCFHALPITFDKVDNCSDPGTYDYFSNSETSFVSTFLGVLLTFGG